MVGWSPIADLDSRRALAQVGWEDVRYKDDEGSERGGLKLKTAEACASGYA